MGCISVHLSKIGQGIKTKMSRIGGMSVRMSKENAIAVKIEKTGGMATTLVSVGKMKCDIYPICSVDMRGNYLDIEPKILWVWDNPAEHNVYSNTNWNVE